MVTNKMHAHERAIDKNLVKRLLAQQFPQLAKLPIEPISSAGTDNAIYRLGNKMIIRLPRIASAAPHIVKEYTWLPRLAPYLSLAIPVPIAQGKPTEKYPWPWLIYQWLAGKNGTQVSFDLHQAAIALGNFVIDLHNIDTTNAPLSARSRPLHTVDHEVRAALNALHGTIDVAAATKAWAKILATPPWDGTPVWTHADLHAGNILVTRRKISAVIDFGMAGIGDPACDMMAAWTLLSAQTRDIFRSIVHTDDATWQRGRGWALSFGLIALPYYKDTNPILAKIALHTINEVIGDLS
jgi:aminoglycoside phosphotransferase (APT) family kinase protein